MKLSFNNYGELRRVPEEFKHIIESEINSFLEDKKSSFESNILANFDSGLDPSGRAWTPLSQATLAQKATDQIMYESGSLRSSYVFNVTKSGKTATLTADNTAPYASYHEYGTRYMPRRRVMADFHVNLAPILNELADRLKAEMEKKK